MSEQASREPVLRPLWLGYVGGRGKVSLTDRCDGCGYHARLASFDAREWVKIGPLPLYPLQRYRVIDLCPLCGHLRRLPIDEYLAWTEDQVAAERELLRADPASIEARLALIWKLYGFGRIYDAAALVTPLLAAGVDEAPIHHAAGVVLRAVGRRGEALAAFRAAVARDPKSALYQLDLGRALSGGKQPALAAHHLELAAKLDPRDSETWLLLAQVRQRRRDWAGAADAWRSAVGLDPQLERIAAFRWPMRLATLMARVGRRR